MLHQSVTLCFNASWIILGNRIYELYTFHVWWIVRRVQRKRVRRWSEISATAPVDLPICDRIRTTCTKTWQQYLVFECITYLISKIDHRHRKLTSNTNTRIPTQVRACPGQTVRPSCWQSFGEIRYNDKVLDRMKRAQIFSLPETYVDTNDTTDERKIDISKGTMQMRFFAKRWFDLKMWHRWFFVEHFEVLHPWAPWKQVCFIMNMWKSTSRAMQSQDARGGRTISKQFEIRWRNGALHDR